MCINTTLSILLNDNKAVKYNINATCYIIVNC